jgi:general secretion pathway protein B
MSSVLKALREQSSPLLQQPAPIWLSSVPTRRPLRWWWVAVTILLVLVLSSYYSWSSGMNSEVSVVQPSARTTNAVATYQLGPSTTIKVPQWDSRTDAATGNQPVAQAQLQQQAPQQGIDLQQVSPDLLAAFEAAVAAQQSGQSTAIQQSVLPAIADLTNALRSQIPSFTYDAHQYSSRDSARNVTFSGQRLIEGDVWQGLTIMRITPTHVVLSRNQVAFQQPALEDWTRPQ